MMKFLVAVLFFVQLAQARVFNMKENSFAGFFNATYGTSSVNKDYFEGESSSTAFSKGFTTNTGGEFGFIYNMDKFSWLFGLEVIKPAKTRGVASTGANQDYSYTADLSVYAPKLGLELIFYQNNTFRLFANGSVGTASLSMKTQYSALTIAPNTNFEVEGKGTANLLNYSIGGEMHWTDNTTVSLALGYRQLDFKKIKYLDDVATSFTGAHSKGERILKSDGSALGYDFTNGYIMLGLRFWLH